MNSGRATSRHLADASRLSLFVLSGQEPRFGIGAEQSLKFT